MQEFDHPEVFKLVCPSVGGDVDHGTQKLEEQIGVLISLVGELDIAVHISFKSIQRVGVELSDITAHFEEESVAVLESSLDKLLMLVVLSHDFSIARICGKINGQGDKFLTHNRLRTVDNKLVHDGDALSIRECCLKLIFLGHMVEKLQNKSAETRRFEDLNELGNHTSVIDLVSNLSIKRQVEEETKSDLEKQLVVTGDEPIELVDNIALFHLNFVLTKDTELL